MTNPINEPLPGNDLGALSLPSHVNLCILKFLTKRHSNNLVGR